ncbi:DUF6786 family protein [Candidatus Latescibacterota bacterium]
MMYMTLLKDSLVMTGAMLAGLIFLNMVSCSESPEQQKLSPKNSNQALLDALGEHTQTVILEGAEGRQMIIIPELSARVLGASISGAEDENLMWVDSTIMDGSYWDKKPYFWNAGGLRTWIAPEDLFFVDADKNPDSWFVPESLDPAPFRIVEQSEKEATFEADIDLVANIGKVYRITLKRRIALLSDPPQELGSLQSGIEYVGIEKEHSFTNRSDDVIGVDLPYVCLWSLLQINPSGTTLVPLKEGYDPQKAYREYFNPLGDRLAISGNIISIKIDGIYRLKIGVRPEAAGKGIAFLRDDGNKRGVLFVKMFPVDSEGIYVDKPWGTESDYGDVIELYNDDGNMGGFAEIECHGPAKKLTKGETQSHSLKLHVFRGSIPDLKTIASTLLETDLSKAKFF